MQIKIREAIVIALPALVQLLASEHAAGQARQRAAFVANNGNLEGSVSAYTFNPDDSLHFVHKLVIGSTPSTSMPVPGTNAYAISITPSGQFLAVSHATSSETLEQITILAVHGDATVSLFDTFTTPDSPLDLLWIDDHRLAVTRTNLSVTNQVIIYEFDAKASTLTQIDAENTGTFSTSLAIHPSRQYLYAQTTGGNYISAFAINADGTLDLISTYSNGAYPLGMGISPDGTKLYTGGGISSGSHAVTGHLINAETGELVLMSGSPFFSPDNAPKQVVVSADNVWAIVAHGSSATARTFAIDERTGALTNTGFFFDVGIQGSLGSLEVLDNLLLVSDTDSSGGRGLYSFTLNPNGSLTQNGPLVDSTGVSPSAIAAWKPTGPACPADIAPPNAGDGTVNVSDLLAVIAAWGACADPQDCPADIAPPPNGNGIVNVQDLLAVIAAWGACD